MRLDHINISTPTELLLRVRDFYRDMLGFAEGFRPKLSSNGFWLYSDGKPILHLVESLAHHPNEKQGYLDHFALRASGLSAFLEKLDTAGVSYRLSYLAETNLSQVFLKDPAGIGVEINFPGESV